MIKMLSVSEMESFGSLDLRYAEQRFDEIKVQVLGAATGDESLVRVRDYLHAIEDILAEKHEARRARAEASRHRVGEANEELGTGPGAHEAQGAGLAADVRSGRVP